MIDLVVSSSTATVVLFSLLMNGLQSSSQSKGPFTLLLVCFLILATGPLIFSLMPSLIQFYVSVLPLVFFSLLPCLWLYQDALIAHKKWKWRKSMLWHCSLLPFMFLLGVAIYAVPTALFEQMFFAEQSVHSQTITSLSVVFFVALLMWCALSCVYLTRMLRRTIRYRKSIKNMFSEDEGRNLKWLSWVSMLVGITWLSALLVLIFESQIQHPALAETGVLLLFAALVWLFCLNGLRQRPRYEVVGRGLTPPPSDNDKKTYERSALTSVDLEKIAGKLSAAIDVGEIHLTPEINLARLATYVNEPSQYITQTLSQQLQTSFFDFINQARVADAKRLLVTTQHPVLDIALATGFNSRSSFYKAFKHITGLTPGEYRRSQKEL